MKFLLESDTKSLIREIKAYLIDNKYDLLSTNGGECVQISRVIESRFGLKATPALVLTVDMEPISNAHYVNLLDDNTIIDFTASQFKSYINKDKLPIPVTAIKDKETFKSNTLYYQI